MVDIANLDPHDTCLYEKHQDPKTITSFMK